eukprot:881273_1
MSTQPTKKLYDDLDKSIFEHEYVYENDDHHNRLSLDVNSTCQIYSRTNSTWVSGIVVNIWINTDTNEEWLEVKYGLNKRKQIQRFCRSLRAPVNHNRIPMSIFASVTATPDQCDDPINGCIVVQRLVVMLSYYQKLNVQNSIDSQAIFMTFINDIYTNILDDYSHLVKEHNNDLEAINKVLKEQKVFEACDVTKCRFTSRHQSRNTMNAMKKRSMDPVVQFYAELLDSIHFYLIHLFECGLRTERVNPNDTYDRKEAAAEHNMYYDQAVTRISKIMNERQDIRFTFNRLNNNSSKFNIKAAAVESSEIIYMDEAVRYLVSCGIDENAIRNLWKFLAAQEYDMDSIKEDIKHGLAHAGNIAVNIADKDAVAILCEFVEATELRSSSFDIGLAFYYWPEYETMDVDTFTSQWNINNHGGYKISELFVPQRHTTFKEEIQNYMLIDMAAYEKTMVKVRAYMMTNEAKKHCVWNKNDTHGICVVLKYEFQHGAPLLPRHLLALCLYTDFTDLCTHFSGTFRATKQFEQLSSIRARNSKYWWMAKSLRETVELYGERKEYNEDEWDW